MSSTGTDICNADGCWGTSGVSEKHISPSSSTASGFAPVATKVIIIESVNREILVHGVTVQFSRSTVWGVVVGKRGDRCISTPVVSGVGVSSHSVGDEV